MFCSFCGSFIGDEQARFCPRCGHILNEYRPPAQERPPAPTGHYGNERSDAWNGHKNKVIAATLVLALAFGALISMDTLVYPDDSYKKIEIQTVTDDTYFELSGDFLLERGIFSVSLTDSGSIAFALNEEISSKYDYYYWKLFDRDHVSSNSTSFYMKYNGDTLDKDEPILYFLSQKAGEYDISVECCVESGGDYICKAVYSGTVSYVGTITKEYVWKYQGKEYSAQATFGYEDYRQYRDADPYGRSFSSFGYSRIPSFVTYDTGGVGTLADSLAEAYGGDPAGQDFASFVLAFVQICFDYPPYTSFMDSDKYQYGQDEYFAYPLETIFYGMGDCEDTSILAAALFKALGYPAGVVVIPGHALAAVGLDSYSPGNYRAASYEIISQTVGGITYYACETTCSSPQGIGLVSSYGDKGTPYSEFVGKQRYGFYIV
ncbi:MAG: hypothetical protein LBB30_03355 [Candidatus Methanoplasma sp.]|jgi:hypothetical protein|nr:hypothetical protein [Candidatus Methanoplasma sp.]